MGKTLVYQPSVYRLTILYRVFSPHVLSLGSYCNHPVNTTYKFFRFRVCVVFRFTLLPAATFWKIYVLFCPGFSENLIF
jgi:hypothetical protein